MKTSSQAPPFLSPTTSLFALLSARCVLNTPRSSTTSIWVPQPLLPMLCDVRNVTVRQEPGGRPVNVVGLATATARLNSRLPLPSLSSRELWTQRNQFIHEQLPLSDYNLMVEKHEQRSKTAFTIRWRHSQCTSRIRTILARVIAIHVGPGFNKPLYNEVLGITNLDWTKSSLEHNPETQA